MTPARKSAWVPEEMIVDTSLARMDWVLYCFMAARSDGKIFEVCDNYTLSRGVGLPEWRITQKLEHLAARGHIIIHQNKVADRKIELVRVPGEPK